jgi:hypothetical protein
MAKKEGNSAPSRSGRTLKRIDILYEITPTNEEDGSWKKWVRIEELYEIVNELKPNNVGKTPEESVSLREERGDTDGTNSE